MLGRGWFGGILLVVAGASSAGAQGVIFPSSGAKHQSMAGASTAAPVDAAGATYWNPAAMAGMEDGEIFIGVDFLYANTFLDASVEGLGSGSNRSDSGLSGAPAIGLVTRPENSDYTYGLNIRGLVGRAIDFPGSEFNPVLQPYDPPRTFGLGPVSSRRSGLQIDPMMSKQITDQLAVGVGAQVAAVSFAWDPALFAARNPNGLFPPATQSRSYWGAGFQGGVLYSPGSDWDFGASFKSPIWFETFEYNSKDDQGRARSLALDVTYPWVLSFGAGYRGVEKTIVAVDFRYFNYESSKPFGLAPREPGTGGGLGWSNVAAFAVGIQREVHDMVDVQGGFSWNGDPLPNGAATLLNIQVPALNKVAFSFGLTVALTERVDIVGGFLYALQHSNSGSILEIPGSAIELRQDLSTFNLGFAFKL